MEDEFRKPFEYNEEKRGFILVFTLLLITFDILQTLSLTSQVYEVFKNSSILQIIAVTLGVIFVIYILYTAVICYSMKANTVNRAKTYLIVRAILSTCYVMIVFLDRRNHLNLIGDGVEQYKTTNDMIVGELIIPLAYVLVFSLIWFLYFSLSKRCKEIGKKL
jgi:hypothetical protein